MLSSLPHRTKSVLKRAKAPDDIDQALPRVFGASTKLTMLNFLSFIISSSLRHRTLAVACALPRTFFQIEVAVKFLCPHHSDAGITILCPNINERDAAARKAATVLR
jgi:hypothetical protein